MDQLKAANRQFNQMGTVEHVVDQITDAFAARQAVAGERAISEAQAVQPSAAEAMPRERPEDTMQLIEEQAIEYMSPAESSNNADGADASELMSPSRSRSPERTDRRGRE